MAEETVPNSALKTILKLQNLEQAEVFFLLDLCIYHKVVMVAVQASVIFKNQALSNKGITLS